MRKLFTLITLFAGAVAATATDYTDELEVIIDGMSTKQPAVISVDEQGDGKYTLSLNNFVLMGQMPVGNIVLKDVEGTVAPEVTTIQTKQSISIEPGNMEGILEQEWMGPNLGLVPVDMTAEIRDNKLYTVINIAMAGMKIGVVFGNGGYQIGNSDFELFHTAKIADGEGKNEVTSDEPNCWHSFMSGSSDNPTIAYLAGYAPHTFISDITRPGTQGKSSVLVTSVDMWFTIANGTITTGRINAGSTTAADLSNHSWLDLSQTATDANGDPFHAIMNGMPDSLSVWVKFKQKTPKADFPYATVNAVITDGTYYQDPEDKEYTNVLAKATNNKIESKNFEWQKLVVPFDYATYEANNAAGKAILVTISTNATPGKGSTDSIYVDDLELIYNCSATAISVKGTPIANFGSAADNTYEVIVDGESADITADDIEVTTDGKGARVTIETADVDCIGGGSDAIITVTSNDLKKSNTYYVNTRSAQYAGINNASVNAGGKEEVKAIYNMNGQMVKTPAKGSVCIVKYTNGKTVKKIVK